MEAKAPLDLRLLDSLKDHPLLAAYIEITQLKRLYRQGWLRRGISRERCESVADHIFGMTLLAWMLTGEGLFPAVDREKVLRMVLVHELGEIYAGDIVPGDQVDPEVKHHLEREGFVRVSGRVAAGAEWLDLWEEFEAGETPEAQLARQLDRLEMGLQAMVYAQGGHPNLEEFFVSASSGLQSDVLVRLFNTALRMR